MYYSIFFLHHSHILLANERLYSTQYHQDSWMMKCSPVQSISLKLAEEKKERKKTHARKTEQNELNPISWHDFAEKLIKWAFAVTNK